MPAPHCPEVPDQSFVNAGSESSTACRTMDQVTALPGQYAGIPCPHHRTWTSDPLPHHGIASPDPQLPLPVSGAPVRSSAQMCSWSSPLSLSFYFPVFPSNTQTEKGPHEATTLNYIRMGLHFFKEGDENLRAMAAEELYPAHIFTAKPLLQPQPPAYQPHSQLWYR